MIEVSLQHGVLLLDDEDEWVLTTAVWRSRLETTHNVEPRRYVVADKPYRRIHRVLLDAPRELMVDHVNNNGLDNRRLNLRLATNSQNQANRHPRRALYKGVSFHRKSGKWQAQIGRPPGAYLGLFDTAEDAALAYAAAATERFGEFANHDGDVLERRAS